MARKMKWTRVGLATPGLSHAELVKAAEDAAKRSIMRDSAQVTSVEVTGALEARRTASSG
jgi:hypothetical protein